jgi:plasmid stabilization system protein ParE
MDSIAQDNPAAALELDLEFEVKADSLPKHPKLYKPGRMKGTREIVVRPNYVMVYAIPQGDFPLSRLPLKGTEQAGPRKGDRDLPGVEGDTITILRVLHTAQQWP